MKPHSFHLEAEEEYARAAADYARISPKLGGRFYDEIERLIAEVRARPSMYRFIRKPVRRHFTYVFPYGILYVDRPEEVRIVAVMHLRSKPLYWTHRVD